MTEIGGSHIDQKTGYHRAWLFAVLAIDGCFVAARGHDEPLARD
jgi:hypothetical protein